jgi:hypothetical protein
MPAPKKYPDELRERGVRLALESNRPISLVERFVSYWQFDLRQLLIAQIRELQHRRKAR